MHTAMRPPRVCIISSANRSSAAETPLRTRLPAGGVGTVGASNRVVSVAARTSRRARASMAAVRHDVSVPERASTSSATSRRPCHASGRVACSAKRSCEGKYRSSVAAREPQNPTKSEEHQRHLQGVLYIG
eukprot:5592888-Pyramimonas_sp.AAC.1